MTCPKNCATNKLQMSPGLLTTSEPKTKEEKGKHKQTGNKLKSLCYRKVLEERNDMVFFVFRSVNNHREKGSDWDNIINSILCISCLFLHSFLEMWLLSILHDLWLQEEEEKMGIFQPHRATAWMFEPLATNTTAKMWEMLQTHTQMHSFIDQMHGFTCYEVSSIISSSTITLYSISLFIYRKTKGLALWGNKK